MSVLFKFVCVCHPNCLCYFGMSRYYLTLFLERETHGCLSSSRHQNLFVIGTLGRMTPASLRAPLPVLMPPIGTSPALLTSQSTFHFSLIHPICSLSSTIAALILQFIWNYRSMSQMVFATCLPARLLEKS